MPRRIAVVVVAGLLELACLPVQVQAQTAASPAAAVGAADVTALTQEVKSLRRTIDGLSTVVRGFVVESGQRERATLLLRRIEVGEQQLAHLKADLKDLGARREVAEQGLQQSRGRISSARSMLAFNPDAKTADLLLQEQTQAGADEQSARSSVEQIQPRIAELEAEIARRREAIRALEAALEKELAGTQPR